MLDAYHQRELKSCNRSKKHPWAGKSKSGGRGKGNGKSSWWWGYMVGDRLGFVEAELEAALRNQSTDPDCERGNRQTPIGQDWGIAPLLIG